MQLDKSLFYVSAPGRADFLNTHQDYKGLPVVPAAVNLRTYMVGEFWDEDAFYIKSIDLKKRGEKYEDHFLIKKKEVEYENKGWFGNYFRSLFNVARRVSHEKIQGMHITVKSQIPIGSGLASSAALEVAFIYLLNQAYDLGYDKRMIAEIAYSAENIELEIPCGRLDQYAASFGGVIELECRHPYNVNELPVRDLTFVILDSGIRHSTAEIHPIRQKQIDKGLQTLIESNIVPESIKSRLGFRYYEPMWEDLSEKEVQPYMNLLTKESADRIIYTIRAQRSTELALRVLENSDISSRIVKEVAKTLGLECVKVSDRFSRLQLLGCIMNYQHELMRDLYDLSLAQLERIREAALDAGAYGVKISGAGVGGSLIALVRDEFSGQKVLEAGASSGASMGWVSKVDVGAKTEEPNQVKLYGLDLL